MHFDFASVQPTLHAFVLAATAKKTSSNPIFFILIIIALGAYLWIRPQRKRIRAQQQNQQAIEVGDQVVTASGIIGRVLAIRDDQVDLEIAPGTTITVVRRAVGTRLPPPIPADDTVPDDDGPSSSSTGWTWEGAGTNEEGKKDDKGHDGPTAATGGSS